MTSFETAKKLKESGFPQPSPKFGQVWYDPYGMPAVVLSTKPLRFGDEGGQSWSGKNRFGEMIFAPTATDILRELPRNWMLWFYEGSEIENPAWEVGKYERGDGFDDQESNSNPAEACAAAWLKLKLI